MKHEERKIKAIEILEKMDIYKPYIKGFRESDKVCFFERFGGYWVDQEPEIYNKMKEIEVIYKDRLRDSLVLTVSDKMQKTLKSIVEKFNELESRIIKNKLDYSLLWKCEYAKANLISIMMDLEEMCN